MSASAASCAILGWTVGEVLDDPNAWSLASRCAQEAFDVARARGVTLGFDDPAVYTREFGAKIRDARPSMLLDLLAGRRCEIDVINGAIPPAASAIGLDAPANEVVTALVRAREARPG